MKNFKHKIIMKQTFLIILSFFLVMTSVMVSDNNLNIEAEEEKSETLNTNQLDVKPEEKPKPEEKAVPEKNPVIPNKVEPLRELGYDKGYSVRKISSADGTFSAPIKAYKTYKEAVTEMASLSKNGDHIVTVQVVDERDNANKNIPDKDKKEHTRIVAQAQYGFAQSYPYRLGSVSTAAVKDAKNTLDIYSNVALTNNIGYFPAHYQMQVHNVVESGGSFAVEIEISGQRGYVDINKVDLIPLFYIQNQKPVLLGGNESYYKTPEKQYSKVVEAETYTVKNVNGLREITFNSKRTTPATQTSSTTYGLTPAWLAAGVYYSNDGVHFYKNIERTQKVMDGTVHGEFYAYFQWLPVNTISLHNGDVLSNLLESYGYKNSVYYDQSHAFIENGNKYGMNSLLVFAQASLESGYGTSDFARNRNNLFGWGAADSNPGGASYFDSVSDSVNLHMSQNLRSYMDPSNWKHYGFSFGNMSSGVSYRYASDPLYGIKVAGIAFTLDKQNNFKDYDNYQLMKITNKSSNPFLAEAGKGATLYSNKNLPNQVIASLGNIGAYTKTHSTVPKDGARSPMNLLKEHAYIVTSALSPIKKSGPAAIALPTSLVTVDDKVKKYTFNSAQPLRTEWNGSSRVLSTVPKGVQLSGKETTNGYVQIEYGDHIGYVLKSQLTEGPAMPVINQSGDYKVKSDPYGTLSLRESASTGSTKLNNIPNGTNLTAIDDGKMPWLKTTYEGKTGYVHSDYLALIILNVDKPVEPPKPVFPKGDVNGDGKVSLSDAMLIRNHLLGYIKMTDEEQKRADVDANSKISLADAMRIRNYLLGYSSLD